MDLLSLGVILLILAASGGIAFVADGLGKKIGKKRVSVFNLRPKHVAQLGTVGMGVFVSGLTIGFIMAVSGDARAWLLRGRKILADNQSLYQENLALQETNKGVKAESDHLRSQNEGVKDTNLKLADANRRLDFSLRKDRADLVVLQDQRKTLLEERTRLGGQVTLLKEGLRGTRVALTDSRASLDKVRVSLAFYREAVRRAQAAVIVARRNLGVTEASLKVQIKNNNDALMQNQALNLQNRELQADVALGEASVKELTAKKDDAEREYTEAKSQLDVAQAQYEALVKANKNLLDANKEQADFLKGGFQTSRTQAMMFRRGEEVARVVAPAGADEKTANSVLASLLRGARREAETRGAKGHRANGESFQAADIVDRKDPKSGEVLSADDLKRKIVAGLAGAREDQVLVATSSLNAFTGEVVSLDLAVLPNPVVYRRNDTVAETQIDGGQTEDRILADLSDFYIGQVRERAMRDRMVPRAGNAAPFGGIPDADVFNLVQTVKRAGRAVRVQAIAENDIRAADLLRLEFRVR